MLRLSFNNMFNVSKIFFVLITVFTIFIFLMVGFRGCTGATGVDRTAAESEARSWAANMGIKDARVNCVSADSNGDGYVSCTIGYTNVTGFHTQPLECASRFTLNSGCRIPVIMNNSAQQ